MVEERYEIRGKIGQGGVGAVYKAYDTQLRREVAIKRVLSDELDMNNETATKNLLQEATALSSVQHPHICTVYDAGIDDEGPFVVMELINGKTLDEMVERGTLTYADFREVAIQSQEAMIAAQELNLVHRDLKPSNVMVSWLPSGRFQVKLVDFGLAKFSPKPSLQTIDHGDSVFGSIFFMAPEQFERVELDQRTDMYSLGAMFYFTLAGIYPFNGETAPQVMAAHLQHTVTPLQELRPDLPHWLCEWVMWHIQRDMADRPDSARIALERFLSDESTHLHTMSGTQQVAAAAPPVMVPYSATTTPTPSNVSNATAPQPILAPNGRPSPSTAPVAIQSANAIIANQATQTAAVNQNTAPTEAPVPPETNVEHILQSRGPNKTLIISICAVLALAIIGIAFVLFGTNEDNERNEVYTQLTRNIESKFKNKETLSVTKKEMEYILDTIADPETSDNRKIGGYYALSMAKSSNNDFSPSLETAIFSTTKKSLTESVKDQLFQTVFYNRPVDKEAQKILVKYAENTPNDKTALNIVNGMKPSADDSNLPSLLNIYSSTTSLATQTACADVIVEIIKKSNRKQALANDLIKKYESANSNKLKYAYLRILGVTGTTNARETLELALKSSDKQLQAAASRGLSNFPTIDPFQSMLNVFANEKAESRNKRIREDIYKLLENAEKMNYTARVNNWKTMITKSPSIAIRRQVIGKIGQFKEQWSNVVLKDTSENTALDSSSRDLAKDLLK